MVKKVIQIEETTVTPAGNQGTVNPPPPPPPPKPELEPGAVCADAIDPEKAEVEIETILMHLENQNELIIQILKQIQKDE